MAYIQDSTQSFTITLTAFLEGLGILTSIVVLNLSTSIEGEWTLFGGWITPIPNVTEGDSIVIIVYARNDGQSTDTLFGQFVSADVTPIESLIQEVPNVGIGVETNPLGSWSFAMPPKENVSITINAGHVE